MGTHITGRLMNLTSFNYCYTAAVVVSQQFYIAENMVNYHKMVHPPCRA